MATAPRQAGQALSEGRIQTFDKGRVQVIASSRSLQQVKSRLVASLCHASEHLDDSLVLRSFDHRSNQDVWPSL
jgi:hypothetical protein